MSAPIEQAIYRHRFSEAELESNRLLWAPICRYLQRYVNPDGVTLDLGAGYCHFINQIQSREKIAVDINADALRRYATPGVRCLASMDGIPPDSLHTVFASNVYEHFPSQEAVAESFASIHRALKPGGQFLIMQPNFAHCAKRYFDFFDHRLIFTHRGMQEGLEIHGYRLARVVDRFLPYTTKSALPKSAFLVDLYLRFPQAWRFLGGQMLLVAVRD